MGKKLSPANCMKEYLTEAPYLIFVFKQVYSITEDGKKKINHYNEMSANIAVGMLLTAIHVRSVLLFFFIILYQTKICVTVCRLSFAYIKTPKLWICYKITTW